MTDPLAVLPSLGAPALGADEFRAIAALVGRVAGINLPPGKEGLVRARLARRLRALDLDGFAAYLRHVEQDGTRRELKEMVDALTTNKTSFFREPQHFDYLREAVLPAHVAAARPPRVWSAGCSSGEEPYTLAMVLHDALPPALAGAARILATDISARMLARAGAATYAPELVAELPRDLVRRHFTATPDGQWTVAPPVRRLVRFARLNLVGAWPMRGPFDAIFCRNVMIYFDKATQAALVERFWALLAPGGHLFVGHSESLTGLAHRFAYVRPAVYVKGA
ncbi:MAG TPA: protein-glutamate O-methyltransferase CheR [Gemmatimonadaceae bacterium]|nr:protein-glutamate O-methyltransferase CheR [Gemmatimonadaceae bacterium]